MASNPKVISRADVVAALGFTPSDVLFKGTYDPATAYNSRSIIHHRGSAFVAKSFVPSQNAPQVDDDGVPQDDSFWGVFIHKGDKGERGDSGDSLYDIPVCGGWRQLEIDSDVIVVDAIPFDVVGTEVISRVYECVLPNIGDFTDLVVNTEGVVIESHTELVWQKGSMTRTFGPTITTYIVPAIGDTLSLETDRDGHVTAFELPESDTPVDDALVDAYSSYTVPSAHDIAYLCADETGVIFEYLDEIGHYIGPNVSLFGGVDAVALPTYPWNGTNWDNWTDADVVHCLIGTGQSNMEAVNKDADDVLISSVPIYPDHALMPNTGLRLTDTPMTSLQPLKESTTEITDRKETLMSGFANHLIKMVDDAVGVKPTIVCAVAALTAQTYDYLGRGSPYYNRIMTFANRLVAFYRSQGKRVKFSVVWVQGEAEQLRQAEAYAASMNQDARGFDADLRTISGQIEPVLFYAPMVYSGTNKDLDDADYYELGTVRAYDLLRNHSLIRICNPHYPMPITEFDKLHLLNQGQYRTGKAVARAYYAENAGIGWTPFMVRREGWTWKSATELWLEMAVPNEGNLVIVENEAVTPTVLSNKGFQISSRGVMLNYTVDIPEAPSPSTTKRWVRFKFTAPVTGSLKATYALRKDDPGTYNGPVYGGRGVIADDSAHVSLFDGYACRNWLVPFSINIPAP